MPSVTESDAMWLWAKMVLTVIVALMPGGFVVLLTWALARAIRQQWLQVQARTPAGQPVALREVLASLHVRDIVRQARLQH